MAWLARQSSDDAEAFLARVIRFDPASVVRLKPANDGLVVLWSRLPFEVLVSRGVPATVADDRTVKAAALLKSLKGTGELPPGRDTDWRWPLPKLPGRTVERLPVPDVLRIGAAAARTMRTASDEGVAGRAVGSRALRDALLGFVPIRVTTDDGAEVAVQQRLVQAVCRMAFMNEPGAGSTVEVRVSGPWVGLIAEFGSAWHRPPLLLT
jgi:hypothetical protein